MIKNFFIKINMEVKRNTYTSKFISQTIKEKLSRDNIQKNPYDIVDLKIKKYKSLEDNARTLLNFFMHKNKFKSYFDRKGAKKFLNEKTKAMEEIVLIDEVKEDIHEKFIENSKKSKSHNKIVEKYKHLKQHYSHNELVNIEEHNFNSNKKRIKFEESKNGNASFVSFRNMIVFNNSIENQKTNKQNGFIESTKNNKNELSTNNIYDNEPSYLMTGENDSFIYSIIKEMN